MAQLACKHPRRLERYTLILYEGPLKHAFELPDAVIVQLLGRALIEMCLECPAGEFCGVYYLAKPHLMHERFMVEWLQGLETSNHVLLPIELAPEDDEAFHRS